MVEISSIKGNKDQAKGKIEKAPKIKLTKEQVQYVQDIVRLENRIAVCREFIALWTNFFRFFCDNLADKEITPEEEKVFFQLSTQLARKHFMFVELMGDVFDRGNDIINVLVLAVSLNTLQNMPENTYSKLELDWHSLFLDMNKALGRLVRMLPTNLPLSEALASLDKTGPVGTNPAAGAAGKSPAKGGGGKSKMLAAVLAFPPMGMLGLDCFYLGLTMRGVLRIVTLGVGGLWPLIDFVRILMGKVEDSNGQIPS